MITVTNLRVSQNSGNFSKNSVSNDKLRRISSMALHLFVFFFLSFRFFRFPLSFLYFYLYFLISCVPFLFLYDLLPSLYIACFCPSLSISSQYPSYLVASINSPPPNPRSHLIMDLSDATLRSQVQLAQRLSLSYRGREVKLQVSR